MPLKRHSSLGMKGCCKTSGALVVWQKGRTFSLGYRMRALRTPDGLGARLRTPDWLCALVVRQEWRAFSLGYRMRALRAPEKPINFALFV